MSPTMASIRSAPGFTRHVEVDRDMARSHEERAGQVAPAVHGAHELALVVQRFDQEPASVQAGGVARDARAGDFDPTIARDGAAGEPRWDAATCRRSGERSKRD